MLSKSQNDLLTQTGPGTPGGRFLRGERRALERRRLERARRGRR